MLFSMATSAVAAEAYPPNLQPHLEAEHTYASSNYTHDFYPAHLEADVEYGLFVFEEEDYTVYEEIIMDELVPIVTDLDIPITGYGDSPMARGFSTRVSQERDRYYVLQNILDARGSENVTTRRILPPINGLVTGTIRPGEWKEFNLTTMRSNIDVEINSLFSFFVTSNSDLDLYLIDTQTGIILDAGETIGRNWEEFALTFTGQFAPFVNRDLSVILISWGPATNYTLYAGEMWLGRDRFMANPAVTVRPLSRHNFTADTIAIVRMNARVLQSGVHMFNPASRRTFPHNAIMAGTPTLAGFISSGNTPGNIGNFRRFMHVPSAGGELSTQASLVAFQNWNQIAPTFHYHGRFNANPMGIPVVQDFGIRATVTQNNNGFTWEPQLNFHYIFPATRNNVAFLR